MERIKCVNVNDCLNCPYKMEIFQNWIEIFLTEGKNKNKKNLENVKF